MKKDKYTLHDKLLRLIRLDYDIQYYGYGQRGILILSYSHINSIYNGLVFIHPNGTVNIDRQYHSKSRIVENILVNVGEKCLPYMKNNKIDKLTDIMNKYHEKAIQVAKAKSFI